MNAIFSADGLYRRMLSRGDIGRRVLFVGLNPSTAGKNEEDQTTLRLWGFTSTWGYDGYMLGNLYGAISTAPSGLTKFVDPVGSMNDEWLQQMLDETVLTVVMWGASKYAQSWRTDRVLSLLRAKRPVYCLGRNKDGSPKHPLYLKGDTRLVAYHG